MKTFMSYRNAVKGLAALALVFTVVSCGSKKGGGSTATPAGSNGDCSSSSSNCSVGQKYSSGTFLGAGTGENQYGYDKYISMYLGFFAKGSVQKQNNYVSYSGDVVANGTIKITKGSYGLLTNQNPNRMISAITFDFYWDFGYGSGYNNGGGYDYSYPDYGYDYGYNDDYGYGNCGYSGGCNSCNTCGNNNGGNQSSVCELPAGTYKVATTTAGDWYDGSYAQVTGLKLKITGSSKTVVATFNGYLNNYGSNSNGQLSGNLNIQTVNGQSCNYSVVF